MLTIGCVFYFPSGSNVSRNPFAVAPLSLNIFIFLGYAALTAKAEKAEQLAKSLQAARLEMEQLRARHPHPRMTVEEAADFSDKQIETIIILNDKKDERAADVIVAMAVDEEVHVAVDVKF